jgi:hypothetical protein
VCGGQLPVHSLRWAGCKGGRMQGVQRAGPAAPGCDEDARDLGGADVALVQQLPLRVVACGRRGRAGDLGASAPGWRGGAAVAARAPRAARVCGWAGHGAVLANDDASVHQMVAWLGRRRHHPKQLKQLWRPWQQPEWDCPGSHPRQQARPPSTTAAAPQTLPCVPAAAGARTACNPGSGAQCPRPPHLHRTPACPWP